MEFFDKETHHLYGKKKNNNIGTAFEDVIINKEDNTNDSTDR